MYTVVCQSLSNLIQTAGVRKKSIKMATFKNGKLICPRTENVLANSESRWTECRPPIEGYLVRRTLQLCDKDGDIYEVTITILEDTK